MSPSASKPWAIVAKIAKSSPTTSLARRPTNRASPSPKLPPSFGTPYRFSFTDKLLVTPSTVTAESLTNMKKKKKEMMKKKL